MSIVVMRRLRTKLENGKHAEWNFSIIVELMRSDCRGRDGTRCQNWFKIIPNIWFVFVIALLVKYSPLCDNIFTFILLFKLSFVFF